MSAAMARARVSANVDTASSAPSSRPDLLTSAERSSELWASVGLVCGLFAVGQAVQVNRGAFDPLALQWLTFALLACAVGVLRLPLKRLGNVAESALVLLAGAGFGYQVAQLITTIPGNIGNPPPEAMRPYLWAVTFAAVLGGAGLSRRPWLGRLVPVLLVGLYLYLGRWIIQMQPAPFIDVYVFQRDAAHALFAGQNPYAMRFPDIYGGHSPLYGPGLSVNGQLQFGFPYPPVSLLLATLGQALGGDPRYSQVACIGLAGLLIAYARPGRVANAALALFLFTPRTLFIIDQGWTEPYVVLGLAATAFAAIRAPRATPYFLGALLVTKQYMALALPLAWLLLPRGVGWRAQLRWMLKATATGAVLTLPFALWDISEFWRGVVALQVKQPFRFDALSFLVWWARSGHPPPPTVWAFGAAALGVGLSLWRAPRDAFGFAAAVALTFLLFFAFNKQAFCNYYYFVIGALAVAVGAAPPPASQAPDVVG